MKDKIQKWYPELWNIDMVREAVEKGLITEDDFYEITGEKY